MLCRQNADVLTAKTDNTYSNQYFLRGKHAKYCHEHSLFTLQVILVSSLFCISDRQVK
jgi:hypothetical protein